MNKSFGKKYKLCSQKTIQSIFENGTKIKGFSPFFLRYTFIELEDSVPFQITISVPKRKFKRAVDRNKLKRLTREAVRHKKHLIENPLKHKKKQLALFLIYTETEIKTYSQIENKIEALFLRLEEKI